MNEQIDPWDVEAYLNGTCDLIEVRKTYITVELPAGLSTEERGRRLMGLEKILRKEVDVRAEVFLRPTQDANRLRQLLRGVTL